MPIDRRFTPAARKSRNFSASNVPGFASSVISASAASGSRARNAASRRSIAAAENRLGVPPPKKIEYTRRPQTGGSASSRSAMSASTYASSGQRFAGSCELKSQYGHLRTHHGDVDVERERGERGEAERAAGGGKRSGCGGHDRGSASR